MNWKFWTWPAQIRGLTAQLAQYRELDEWLKEQPTLSNDKCPATVMEMPVSAAHVNFLTATAYERGRHDLIMEYSTRRQALEAKNGTVTAKNAESTKI